jgi:hypothetical protein
MENLARWAFTQAIGWSLTVMAMFRDYYKSAVPFDGLQDLLLRYGDRASGFGIALCLFAIGDMVSRASSPDRQWQCAGPVNHWLATILLFLLVVYSMVFGISLMSDSNVLIRILSPGFAMTYGVIIAGTLFLSACYAVRLDFVVMRAKVKEATKEL